jgi:hypothetical protein
VRYTPYVNKKGTSKISFKRLDPELWEACKEEAVQKMGKFSARAMQQAVLLYKKRGGRYEGEKPVNSGLAAWTRADKKSMPKGMM